jgi:predicted component of type VI protein secretion system
MEVDMSDWKIDEMCELIKQMRHVVEELKEKSGPIQAVERNLDRILANIKMLELNVSDVKELI